MAAEQKCAARLTVTVWLSSTMVMRWRIWTRQQWRSFNDSRISWKVMAYWSMSRLLAASLKFTILTARWRLIFSMTRWWKCQFGITKPHLPVILAVKMLVAKTCLAWFASIKKRYRRTLRHYWPISIMTPWWNLRIQFLRSNQITNTKFWFMTMLAWWCAIFQKINFMRLNLWTTLLEPTKSTTVWQSGNTLSWSNHLTLIRISMMIAKQRCAASPSSSLRWRKLRKFQRHLAISRHF